MYTENDLACVILAGGFGTRLAPLTDIKPKPLVNILDTPVLQSILCSVKKANPSKITVSTHFHAEEIERFCREKHPDVVCKKECVPLGTAGGVKFCSDGKSDDVLVVSGDAVFDFSLADAVNFHKRKGCDVTIVACRKEDPTRYGTLVTDDDGNVVSFYEKPSWKKVRSSLVNTGIYVLSKRALGAIPDNIVCDFSINLFPKLLREGADIKAFITDGYWCDIGCFSEYCACNKYAAIGKLCCVEDRGVAEMRLAEAGIHAERGVYVSKSSIIGRNVRLADGSIVCANTHIADNCDISSSVVGAGSRIGAGSSVAGAVIGEGCAVGENCIIPEDCVIGDGSRLADGAVLKRGEKIPARSAVHIRGGRKVFSKDDNIFVDDGLCVFDTDDGYENMIRLSRAVSVSFAVNNKMGAAVCVMSSKNALHLKNIFVSALQAEGAYVFDCSEGNEAMCAFSASRLDADVSIFFSVRNGKAHIAFFGRDGKKIDDGAERKISKAFGLVQNSSESGGENNMSRFSPSLVPLFQLYMLSLSGFAKRLSGASGLDGMEICVLSRDGNDNASVSALTALLERMSCTLKSRSTKDTVNITVSSDGTRASVRYGNTILDHEHICAVIMKNKELLGAEGIFADKNAPSALRNLQDGGAVFSPYKAENLIFSDGAFAVIAFLSALAKRRQSPDVLLAEIPPFEIFTDEYIADVNRAETAERLSKMYSDSKSTDTDGIRLCLADGNVTVIPSRAKGFKIVSEAQSMEAARELSIKIGDIIKGKK